MSTFLFDALVFGPVYSRRLGNSLGINLLPTHCKLCNFNCLYCECGWSGREGDQEFQYPSAEQLREELGNKLEKLLIEGENIDSITFAGNGEPTLHPEFSEIMAVTADLRDRFFPKTQIAVLSNATRIHLPAIREALLQADIFMLKLDAGTEESFRSINQPPPGISLGKIVENLRHFTSGLVIQSLFVRGWSGAQYVDNTTEVEVSAWLEKLNIVQPDRVIIYSIEREPAAADLEKVPKDILEGIAERVRKAGIKAEVY